MHAHVKREGRVRRLRLQAYFLVRTEDAPLGFQRDNSEHSLVRLSLSVFHAPVHLLLQAKHRFLCPS